MAGRRSARTTAQTAAGMSSHAAKQAPLSPAGKGGVPSRPRAPAAKSKQRRGVVHSGAHEETLTAAAVAAAAAAVPPTPLVQLASGSRCLDSTMLEEAAQHLRAVCPLLAVAMAKHGPATRLLEGRSTDAFGALTKAIVCVRAAMHLRGAKRAHALFSRQPPPPAPDPDV